MALALSAGDLTAGRRLLVELYSESLRARLDPCCRSEWTREKRVFVAVAVVGPGAP